jgi:acetoacetyl-CoA synthetase
MAEFSGYGFHRVIDPPGVMPQAAEKLDNTPKILVPDEVLIDVELLNLDSTSMKQIKETSFNVGKRILEIVSQRGKMHNPVTKSGGVLIGKVLEVGPAKKPTFRLKEGDRIIPLCSLSAIPLFLTNVADSPMGDLIAVKGFAVMNGLCAYTGIPNFLTPTIALSALDVSRLVTQLDRYVSRLKQKSSLAQLRSTSVCILGCGKAGLTAIACLKRWLPNCQILALDISMSLLNRARSFLSDTKIRHVVAQINAQNVRDVLQFVMNHTNGRGCDLVLSCVNVPNVEASCIVAAASQGTILYFSMATEFGKAALGGDSIAKDVEMIIGGGVIEGQAEMMFDLLRQDQQLLRFFIDLDQNADLLHNQSGVPIHPTLFPSKKTPIWCPSAERVANSNMTKFMKIIEQKYRQNFEGNYHKLYQWSVDNLARCWEEIWHFVGMSASVPFQVVVDDIQKMHRAKWFIGSRLNFAENLLKFRDNHPAIISIYEFGYPLTVTYAELYDLVASLAMSLKKHGIKPGDRIVGYLPNCIEAVVAMLATTSLGAVWSCCSPDFGVNGVVDRFGQVEPKILFASNGYRYKGQIFDLMEKIRNIVHALSSIEKVVVIPYTLSQYQIDLRSIPKAIFWSQFQFPPPDRRIHFEQLPFDHPVYIMFSSGTTGKPKCLVQGPGVLLNHLKEIVIHLNVNREDRMFCLSTTGWMVWNWLVSGLGCGCTIVLYDGNPFYPVPDVLLHIISHWKVTVFGCGAKYLTSLEKLGVSYKDKPEKLSSLKTILSTGSPLMETSYDYVYTHLKRDVQLSSQSGGTDFNGCFCLGNSNLPVYRGEIQCRPLGKAVKVFDERGNEIFQQKGELVCTSPFPNMPLYFWNDPDGTKYHAAYFAVYPNVWCHGDFAEITDTGGVIITGRSDATLNPGGVRIGASEYYLVIEQFFADEIDDSLVIGQPWRDDVRVILFVKMKSGKLTPDLKNRICNKIREHLSPRHVPAMVIEVPEIPYTVNNKKVEIAVRKVVAGEEVTNKEALANPHALEYYKNLPELQEESLRSKL